MTKRADIIEAELARIRKKYGRLTRELVVKEAKSKTNPLYNEFDWDNETAAHKHRLDRAQELISVYVTYKSVERKTTFRFPMYVKDPTLPANVGGFVSLRDKMDRNNAIKIITAELDRIESCVERGRAVSGALDMMHPGLAQYFETMLQTVASARRLLDAAE